MAKIDVPIPLSKYEIRWILDTTFTNLVGGLRGVPSLAL